MQCLVGEGERQSTFVAAFKLTALFAISYKNSKQSRASFDKKLSLKYNP